MSKIDESVPMMMRCGHAANAVCHKKAGVTYSPPVPSCAICACIEKAETPDLDGRIARCAYSARTGKCPQNYRDGYGNRHQCDCPDQCSRPSSMELAFFEHLPSEPYDRFYCGCMGWD